MHDSNTVQVEQTIRSLGYDHFGLAPVKKPMSFDIYEQWLNKGFHGEMAYLKEHSRFKENPQSFFPSVRTVISIAQNYYPHPEPGDHNLKAARVAYYAQGKDYHHWFSERLTQICEKLKSLFPNEEFRAYTDSAPILERDLAYQSGLGWVGKNTCLIHPKKGSLFFIGEILTSLSLQVELQPQPDLCGKCNRCIEACPTGALTQPKELDARLCISYWTIESKKAPPENLRKQMGDWLFGCDICQTVCPWNEKIYKYEWKSTAEAAEINSSQSKKDLIHELKWILESSNKSLEKHFKSTPLSRARGRGLKRNALIVIAHRQLIELLPEVEKIRKEPGPWQELAQWVFAQLTLEH